MKGYIKSYKRIMAFMIAAFMVMMCPMTVLAAPSNKTVMNAYNKYLKSHKKVTESTAIPKFQTKTKYFAVVNVDGKGVKELLVADKYYYGGSSPSAGVTEADVLTYYNGRVKYVGSLYAFMGTTIMYSYNLKRAVGSYANRGWIQNFFYTINAKKGSINTHYLEYSLDHNKYYYRNKQISKAKYKSLYKKIATNRKTIKFHYNTARGRRQYLK